MVEKKFECIIDTHSKEERKTLIDYYTDKVGFIISNIDDYEGDILVGVGKDGFNFLVVISSNSIKESEYQHFNSVEEYISFMEKK